MEAEKKEIHDMLRLLGKIGKHDATLWIHSNGDFDNLKFIVCVECKGHEWDFHNVCEAWLWFWEEQARQKQRERSRRADYHRRRYWKKHMFNMEGG